MDIFKILWNIKRAAELKRADLVKTNRINLKSIMIEVEVVNNETLSRFSFATNSSFTTTSWKQNQLARWRTPFLSPALVYCEDTRCEKLFIKVLYFPSDQRCKVGKGDRVATLIGQYLPWMKIRKFFLKLKTLRISVAGSHLAGDWGDGVYGDPGERLHADPSLILTLLGWDLGESINFSKF